MKTLKYVLLQFYLPSIKRVYRRNITVRYSPLIHGWWIGFRYKQNIHTITIGLLCIMIDIW